MRDMAQAGVKILLGASFFCALDLVTLARSVTGSTYAAEQTQLQLRN